MIRRLVIFWLGSLCLAAFAQMPLMPPVPLLTVPPSNTNPAYNFNLYRGFTNTFFNDVTNVGFPRLSGTNFQVVVQSSRGTTFYAVDAMKTNGPKITGPAIPISFTLLSATNVTVSWSWQWFTNSPKVIILFAAGNTLSLTNPIPAMQYYRLRGLSDTSAVIVCSPSLSGPFVQLPGVPLWQYPSQRTPSLRIMKQ